MALGAQQTMSCSTKLFVRETARSSSASSKETSQNIPLIAKRISPCVRCSPSTSPTKHNWTVYFEDPVFIGKSGMRGTARKHTEKPPLRRLSRAKRNVMSQDKRGKASAKAVQRPTMAPRKRRPAPIPTASRVAALFDIDRQKKGSLSIRFAISTHGSRKKLF